MGLRKGEGLCGGDHGVMLAVGSQWGSERLSVSACLRHLLLNESLS